MSILNFGAVSGERERIIQKPGQEWKSRVKILSGEKHCGSCEFVEEYHVHRRMCRYWEWHLTNVLVNPEPERCTPCIQNEVSEDRFKQVELNPAQEVEVGTYNADERFANIDV